MALDMEISESTGREKLLDFTTHVMRLGSEIS